MKPSKDLKVEELVLWFKLRTLEHFLKKAFKVLFKNDKEMPPFKVSELPKKLEFSKPQFLYCKEDPFLGFFYTQESWSVILCYGLRPGKDSNKGATLEIIYEGLHKLKLPSVIHSLLIAECYKTFKNEIRQKFKEAQKRA